MAGTELTPRTRGTAHFSTALVLFLCMAVSPLVIVAQPLVEVPPQERPLSSLRDLNQAFIDIAARVKPTVVTVSTERILRSRQFNPFSPFSNDPFFEFFFGPQPNQPRQREYRQRGLGSGVIVSEDGHILTNNHVVQDAENIYVHTYEGRRFDATIVGVDPQTDIAVLKIDASGLSHIRIGNSDELQVGEIVLAVGSPMSENLAYSVTQGIVSAKGRSNVGLTEYEDFIQTDAAINPGNSGGPLVNLNGELVGLNSAIASRSGGFQGIGFAVPANIAVRVMTSLLEEGKVVRGWLGVTIQDVNEQIADALELGQPGGALVGDVVEDSPADKAGLEPGDLIVSMGRKQIRNSSQLRSSVASMPPGTEVDFEILRDKRSVTIPVTLGEMPSEYASVSGYSAFEDRLGFTVSTFNDALAERYGLDERASGVVVTGIDTRSEAYEAGLREGDLISSVNRKRVGTREQFRRMVSAMEPGDTLLLRVHRESGGFYIAYVL